MGNVEQSKSDGDDVAENFMEQSIDEFTVEPKLEVPKAPRLIAIDLRADFALQVTRPQNPNGAQI